jgi:hypothetical protein
VIFGLTAPPSACSLSRLKKSSLLDFVQQRVLPGPLFSTAGRTPRSADHSAIDTPQFSIDDDLSLQFLKDLVQSAVTIPLVKQTPDGLPLSERFGNISPRGAGAKNPKNSINDGATIEGRTTTWSSIWNHWLDALPLFVVHA